MLLLLLPIDVIFMIGTLSDAKSYISLSRVCVRLYDGLWVKRQKQAIKALTTIVSDGLGHNERHLFNNVLHRDDRPACISTSYQNGIYTKIVSYYKHGVLHRTNGPAICEYENTVLTKAWWYENGICCRRNGGPTYIDRKTISWEGIRNVYSQWWTGEVHETWYSPDGHTSQVCTHKFKAWYSNGKQYKYRQHSQRWLRVNGVHYLTVKGFKDLIAQHFQECE